LINLLNRYSPLSIIVISLLIATIFRIILPWDTVFTPIGVNFQGVDSYYYLRIADIVAQNGMVLPKFDLYFDFPQGLDYSQLAPSYNAYGYFIALIAWVFSFGHVTKEFLDFSAALHPAILGILSLIPLFVITYLLTRNKWIASGAILIGSVMPGEYMGRAMLGSCDTHCLEIFLFSYLMMFTVMSIANGKLKVLYIALAGVIGALYYFIWQGAIIYIILVAGFASLWLVWSRIKNEPDYKTICTILAILSITLILYAIMSFNVTTSFMLLVPIAIMILLISYTAFTRKLKNWQYLLPIGLIALVIIGCVISLKFVGYFFYPDWFNYIVRNIYNLVAWHTQSTTAEELPLLVTLGTVSPEVPLAYFSVAFYLTFIGIGMILYKWYKHNDMNIFLLLVWTVLLLIPTLAMRRFSYYFAVNVIILSTIVIWELCKFNWVKR
jgi:dolichyl-diphosphooligosaccharide--protein glycosyltransferase